jgi:beta-glucosidase
MTPNLRVSQEQITRNETVQVQVDLTNTGQRAGVEIAQLYLRDEVSSVTRPVRELCGFQRLNLQPGETRTVTFQIGPEAVSFYNRDLRRVIEPGWFRVMVGSSSTATLEARFEVK